MRRVDALTNAVRRVVERVLPWYDEANQQARHQKTEQIRLEAIRARIKAEDTERRIYSELDSYRRASERL